MDLSNGAFIESFHSSSPELETDWDWSTKSLRQTMMAFAERQRDDIKNEWINILKLRFRENYDRDYRPQPLAEENQKTSEPQPDLSDEDRLPRENSMLPLGNFVEHLVGENSCEAQTSENQVLDISLSKSDEHLMGKVSCESSTSETPIASINLSGKRIHVIGSYHKARKKNPTTNTKVLREIQYGISEIASDSTAEAGKIAIDHKEETNIAICLEILVTDRVGLLDMHAKDGYIAMEALSEVLQSTQPLIDYFPDSSQWWYKAVPKSKRNEFAEKIQKLMYVSFDEYPCVRLLNLSGQIGRSNPGLNKVVAPIIKLKDVKELDQPHTILVTADEMEEFFTKVSNDLSFGSKIGGVLVESGSNFQQKLKGFSLDKKFPQAQFSHYENVEYKWNSAAPSIMWKNYNFPAYLLSESGISAVQEILFKKKMKHKTYTSDVAKFNRVMETTKIGTHNSEACLGEGTCLPLGRYSVWSSLPPINVSSSNNRKPIVLTAASMDSASFFRDKSFGADSPISGIIALMVALLGAVDVLSRVDGFSNLKRQLVFLVLTGETLGYLGSWRFLHELELHSDVDSGLSDTPIETVLGIGSIGKGLSGGTNTFVAHQTRASSATNMTLDAQVDSLIVESKAFLSSLVAKKKMIQWNDIAETTKVIQQSEILEMNCLMLLLKREEASKITISYNITEFVNVLSCEYSSMDYSLHGRFLPPKPPDSSCFAPLEQEAVQAVCHVHNTYIPAESPFIPKLIKQFHTKVLVQWTGLPISESTWESLASFVNQFPDFNLEDKVNLLRGSIDRLGTPIAVMKRKQRTNGREARAKEKRMATKVIEESG